MKTIEHQVVFEMIQNEIDNNFKDINLSDKSSEYCYGVLEANKRLINLQKQILDMK